jgi:hypothetical protein
MGFANVAEYANADEDGRVWITGFRKAVSAAATVTSSYIDYTYFAGSPLANFYASTPLESALLDDSRGIFLPNVGSASLYLKNITAMSLSSAQNSSASQRQQMILCDYLMYYPFFDTDSIDLQETIAVATLPTRYPYGKVIAIAQAAAASIGQFTFSYTNQDGVGGRTSPNIFTQIVGGGGQSLNAAISGGGFHPYLPLQTGDIGVKSIESVTFTASGGGLMALVIVQPIRSFFISHECRRTTSGNLESYGAAVSVDSLIHEAKAPEIKSGAILGFLSAGHGGSLDSSTLVGLIETTWSN